MYKKNLTPQAIPPVNRIIIKNVATQFVELSDKDLQQIVGGSEPSSAPIGGGKKQD
jgi:bacteriocin-like protein